ncbi:MAG TPA: protoporphyrinogen oxidase, partial [Candidatus Dormibacteraeota bacterium]|nr:protoporphyrinogen oxidase [Candidatus Dormibacteraeota bacterium]
MPARRIAILGGGITGLSAAHRCRELAAQRGLDIETIVLESASTVGGCIETRQDRGFVLEMGPDSLVTEKPAAIDLLKRLELTDDVEPIRENFRGARVVRAGRLIPIPSDFRLFTPMSLSGLITSRLFSPMGIARAAFEPFVPAMVTDVDESLASFVTRRFGREVLDRLAGPLIGGIYSGDPERLSMQATLPQLLDLERRFGSLIRGMRSMQQPSKAALSVHRLVSLRNGLGALVTTLEKKLQGAIRTSSHIVRLRRRHEVGEGAPWSI